MRIALLTYRGNMYCGGQGIYASYLANEWKKAGHEVHVIAGPPYPEIDPDIPLHKIHNENVFGHKYPDWIQRENPLALLKPVNLWELGVSQFGMFPEMQTFGLRLFLRWKALQKRHHFDVVFDNQCLSWGLLGIQAAGTPVVSVIHHPLHIDREADFAIDPRLRTKLRRTLYFPLWMQQAVAPRLARIVTVSEASRREIEHYFKIPEKEIRVVYNGTDLHMFHPIPDKPVETDLIFIGRTEDRKKGIGTLLKALALCPEEITLKIVDGRIPPHGLVPTLSKKLGIEHRITVVNRMLEVPELVEQYSSARVAIVSSFFEGFGFPASEAMSCGLPVIASGGGALPEVIGTDSRCGLVVPTRNPRALATAITSVLSDPEHAAEMGAAARRRVATLFQWKRAAAELIEVFEETIRAAHRRP